MGSRAPCGGGWACVRPAGGDALSFDRRSATRSSGFYGLLVTP
jgi:hypothetical protein